MTVPTEQALHEVLDRCAARNLGLELDNEHLRDALLQARIPPWWHHRHVGIALSAVLLTSAAVLGLLAVRLVAAWLLTA